MRFSVLRAGVCRNVANICGWRSDSPYLHAFDCLEEVHHQMEEQVLVNSMQEIGYKKEQVREQELPNGKKLVRIDFVR